MEEYPKYSIPFEAGEFYHIYNSAVGKERLFISKDNYRFFLDRFHFFTRDVISLYSFCLLANHFHFLIKISDTIDHNSVSEQLRKFFISYSKAFNKENHRRGTLFNKHLKRVKINSDEQLLWTIYYIHRNPVHHKITMNYTDYEWSSYHIFLSNQSTKLKRDEVIGLFRNPKQFISFHSKNLAEDILNRKIHLIES